MSIRETRCAAVIAAFSLCLAAILPSSNAAHPQAYAVQVSADIQTSPPQIQLHWPADTAATNYTISRKTLSETNWTPIATLPGTATNYTDDTISLGDAFEYAILKNTPYDYSGSGYIYSGINVPAVEYRGKIILLLESSVVEPLSAEIQQLQRDLVGDGWLVVPHEIDSGFETPVTIRERIQTIYSQDPQNTRAIFILGHVPVPYSGDYTGDGHENHRGAWATDAYYADMDGTWTDSTVTSTNAEKSWNHNVPGDGKFDQTRFPSDLELAVGRVDFHDLTCFANKQPPRDEIALLRQYLNKNHLFRHGHSPLPRRGLICDGFGGDREALASTGWRNFAPFFGAENVDERTPGTFFSTLSSEGYLWSYGAGGGSYTSCDGIGTSDDFALHDIKTVFTFFFGSYYGDWDNESNFMRAALGSTSYTLTTSWGGRPHWFVHHMALGETIGYSTLLTQNNDTNGLYAPINFGTREVHTTLLGDPSLRMHPVIPPAEIVAEMEETAVTLSWTPSTDVDLEGYFVYRATNDLGPFARISGETPLAATNFVDSEGEISSVYMVRALKLESSASGTYYNLSQGSFARPGILPETPANLTAEATSASITLAWADTSDTEDGFYIYCRVPGEGSFTGIATVGPDATSYEDTNVLTGITYSYKISSFSEVGPSPFSNGATVTVPAPSSAYFLQEDRDTGGTWKQNYGTEGFVIMQDQASIPAYAEMFAAGHNGWVWQWTTADPAATQRAVESTRLAACWYSYQPFEIQFSFHDDEPHRVSLYCLDWDAAGRRQRIEAVDVLSGHVLASQTIEDFQNGVYLTWDLTGEVAFRVTPLTGNAVISGIFFDSPLPTVATPAFEPPGGKYTNSVEITITAETEGAEIRFTTDGSVPSPAAQLYNGPITLTNSATIKARAFAEGMKESAIATETYSVITPMGPPAALVEFLGTDTTRGGTWKNEIGGEGHFVVYDSQRLPDYVTLATSGKSDWRWEYSTQDPRALQRYNGSDRLAACWYSGTSFEVDIDFTDGQRHNLALYCLDWDAGGRTQTVEIIDHATGQVLHTEELSNFSDGIYLHYTITGRVVARFTKLTSYNAVLSGIFFDAPPE